MWLGCKEWTWAKERWSQVYSANKMGCGQCVSNEPELRRDNYKYTVLTRFGVVRL